MHGGMNYRRSTLTVYCTYILCVGATLRLTVFYHIYVNSEPTPTAVAGIGFHSCFSLWFFVRYLKTDALGDPCDHQAGHTNVSR